MLRLACLGRDAACRRNFAHDVKSMHRKSETYYDILNLRTDCSPRDIKHAFVRLSKQYHPDVQSNVANTKRSERFIQITEAYHTLIRPQSRREYDQCLLWPPKGHTAGSFNNEIHRPWEVKPDYNPNPGPYYYGVKGLKRVSNWKVAIFLLSIGIFGAVFGFISVKHAFEWNRQLHDEMTAEAMSHHAAVVAKAQKYGNQEQIRRMIERLARDPVAK